jgi:hypothetical protein
MPDQQLVLDVQHEQLLRALRDLAPLLHELDWGGKMRIVGMALSSVGMPGSSASMDQQAGQRFLSVLFDVCAKEVHSLISKQVRCEVVVVHHGSAWWFSMSA